MNVKEEISSYFKWRYYKVCYTLKTFMMFVSPCIII